MICDNFKVELTPITKIGYNPSEDVEDLASNKKNLRVEKTDDYVAFCVFWRTEFYGTRFLFEGKRLEEFFHYEHDGDVISNDGRLVERDDKLEQIKRDMRKNITNILDLKSYQMIPENSTITYDIFENNMNLISNYLRENGI